MIRLAMVAFCATRLSYRTNCPSWGRLSAQPVCWAGELGYPQGERLVATTVEKRRKEGHVQKRETSN